MGGLYGPILMPRGLDAQENNKLLLLVDGVVDNNLSAGTAQVYMQYSLHDVKRIEIIYGPASALYGANAMAGLINIITRSGEDLKGYRVHAGMPTWDSRGRRAGALGGFSVGNVWGEEGHKVDLSASFHIIDTDGPDLRIDQDQPRSDKPSDPGGANYYFGKDYIGSAEKKTFMAEAKGKVEAIGVSFGGFLWHHNGGQGTYGHEGAVFLNGLQNRPDVWNFHNGAGWASHKFTFGSAANTFTGTYRDTKLDEGYDLYFDVVGSGPDGAGTAPASGSRYYRADHSWKVDDNVLWDIGESMSLTVGESHEKQTVSDYNLVTGHSFVRQNLVTAAPDPGEDASRLYTYKDTSGYAEHIWNVTESFTLTTGIRVDSFTLHGDRTPSFFGTNDRDAAGNCPATAPQCVTAAQATAAGAIEVSRVYYRYIAYDETRTTVNPRVGAVLSALDKKLTLKALYGEGFRMPTVRELFSVSGSRYSNPSLNPEKIRTFELSGTYALEGGGFVELDGFYTRATSLILLTPSTVKRPGRTSLLNQFQNVGEPQIVGFDLKAQIPLTGKIDLFGQYSFQRPEYRSIDAGNLSHDTSSTSLTATSDHIPRQADHKGLVGATIRLWDDKLVLTPRVGFVGERPEIITAPQIKVDRYVVFHLALTVRDIVDGLSATLSAYNLGNEDILDPGFRTANKANDFPSVNPQPGFNALLKLTYRGGF